MGNSPLRVVFDCNVFWRAFFHRNGIGHACSKLIDLKSIQHFVSIEIVEELIDVLTREETLAKFPGHSVEDANEFVKNIVSRSTLVKSVPAIFELPRDIDDEPYLNLAIEVKADFLITADRDMLDLMTGTDNESKQFRQRFRHLTIINPEGFLNLILDRELSLEP